MSPEAEFVAEVGGQGAHGAAGLRRSSKFSFVFVSEDQNLEP